MAKRQATIDLVANVRKFQSGMRDASQSAEGFGGKLGGVAKGVQGFAVGLAAAVPSAAVAAGVALFNLGRAFDEMDGQIAAATGASGEALESLTDSAREVAANVPDSLDKVGEAIGSFNTFLGATDETLEDLTERALDFGRVVDEDLNIDQLGQVANIFGLNAQDLSRSLDDLLVVTQRYGVSANELIGGLQEYGPVFANLGLDVEETAVLFGELTRAGVSVSRIAPGINAFARSVAEDGGNIREEFDGVVDSIREAESVTDALNIATDAFGAEGAQRLTTAIRTGKIDVDLLNDALGNTDGKLEDATEATATWQERFDEFRNWIEDKLEPVATRVFDAVVDAVEKIRDWFESIPQDTRDRFAEAFERIAEASKTIAEQLITIVDKFAELALSDEADDAERLADASERFATSLEIIADIMEGDLKGAFEGLRDQWDASNRAAFEFFGGIAAGIGPLGTALVVELGQAAWDAGQAMYEAIIGWWDTLVENLTIGVESLGRMIWDGLTGLVPGAATGVRNFAGGPIMVGEQGPELVWLPSGSDVYNATETAAMMRGGTVGAGAPMAGMVVNVTVAGSTLSTDRDIARAVDTALRRGNAGIT